MTLPSRQQANPVQLLLLVVVALLCLTLWRQRADTELIEKEYQELARQKKELEQKKHIASIASTPAVDAPLPVATEPPQAAQPAPATPAAETQTEKAPSPPAMVMTPTGLAQAPAGKGLVLAGTHVAPVEGGLQTTMQFNPTTTEPIGLVAIVVRLPADGDSRILNLTPSGSMKYSGVAQRVSEDGKFAVFQGTPDEVAAIEFALSVSGPAVADVRGTTGIGAFDLQVGPTGATATPK